jgi:SAM-dependent methyltransferase
VRAHRIISIGAADDTLELPQEEVRAQIDAAVAAPEPAAAQGIDPSHETGWTPFQPLVASTPPSPPVRPASALPPAQPASAAPAVAAERDRLSDPPRARAEAMLDLEDESPSSMSEDIPVDTDSEDGAEPISDELETRPRLPRAPDSEEIKIEEGDRLTDPGAEEVAPEDLVSIDMLPTLSPPPPPRSPSLRPAPSSPGLTATALMAGATPQAPPVAFTPAAPPAPTAAQVSALGSVPPPPPKRSPPGAPAPGLTGVAAAASPLVVPPVGALAPPPMTDAASSRKKTRPWWEELFNDDFIRTMAKVTDGQIAAEATFIEESLGCEAGAMILDLACGTGRHAVELATRGYQVVGFDLSLAMLARASDEAHDRKQKINFVQGDMRDMTFEETFDGVFSWNTSFGFFDEEKNAGVIAKVHRSLKKGGQFLLDVVNRDFVVRQSPSLAWYEGDGCICMDEMHIDFITSRMKVKRTLMMDDGRTKEIEYSIRVYSLHELGKLLHDNGFRVAEVSGRTGTPGVFFGCESPRTLILAEKR